MIALTRKVSPSIVNCELTHLSRELIDFERAAEQHNEYERTLAFLGFTIRELPALPDNPDSVFVEDTAIVLPEVAILTRPGAASRRSETESVAQVLREYRPVIAIESPGTIDGGDVMVIGSTIYVGQSSRTNRDAIWQLSSHVAPHGYEVQPVSISGCLHLKSAVTRVGDETVLVNPNWVDVSLFSNYQTIEAHPDEPSAANAVVTDSGVIHDAAFRCTRERIERAGIRVFPVDMSELQKAEGAVTCCSILV